MIFSTPPRVTKPGLFITATDTGVGKTVVTCAIAQAMRERVGQVGVCKPFASDCSLEGDELISDDARALAHFAGCDQPLRVVNPIRYALPVAPAVAADETGVTPDCRALGQCLERIDGGHDVLLVEGVGGLLVPLDDQHCVLDLIRELGYPVIVVTRPGLGTLNHTAMTVRLLTQAGCVVSGLVVNGAGRDSLDPDQGNDASVPTNPRWLELMNGVPILAMVPHAPMAEVDPARGMLPETILTPISSVDWLGVARVPGGETPARS